MCGLNCLYEDRDGMCRVDWDNVSPPADAYCVMDHKMAHDDELLTLPPTSRRARDIHYFRKILAARERERSVLT